MTKPPNTNAHIRYLTEEEEKQLTSCLREKYTGYGLIGFILGGVGAKYLLENVVKMTKLASLLFAYGGGILGYTTVKMLCIDRCMSVIRNQPGYGEMLSPKIDRIPIAKESVFETETTPQINMFDDSPITNENANLDVPENKKPIEPRRTVTYEELRRKNRETAEPADLPQWILNLLGEESEPEGRSKKPEPTEFDDITLGTGKGKTKYGDVWD